jgi:hydrogenase 3 maturation protease
MIKVKDPEEISEDLRIIINESPLLIMGIGNELRCDDGFGSLIADSLINYLKGVMSEDLTILNVKNAPEMYLETLEKFREGTILIIDTVEVEGDPGEIILANTSDSEVLKAISTHHLDIRTILEITGVKKAHILGIIPDCLDFKKGLSHNVEKTYTKLLNLLIDLLRSRTS